MKPQKPSRLLTLDSNVFIAAIRGNEPYSDKCHEIISMVPDSFILSEPSILYQEVCGTLARRVDLGVASEAGRQLDLLVHPNLLVNCDRILCLSAYSLCAHYNLYASDAIYMKVALDSGSILVSLDKEDFIERVKAEGLEIEAYHISEFPY
jgi:predicted nucleic acid-binding protein